MSRIGTTLKGLLVGAVAVGALAVAAPASAVTLLSASMDTSNTAYISGPGYSTVNAYIGPVTFHAKDGADEYDFTAYCVDVYHDMFLGALNGGAGYAYHEEAPLTDSRTSTPIGQSGNALDALQRMELSELVNFGATLTKTHASDLSHKLAGVQGAIWVIENPGFTVSGSAPVNAYIAQYVADAGAHHIPVGTIKAVFADDFAHQAFAFAGGVPEPATWTMMILGFGGMGAVLRRRRQAVALA